MFNREPISDPYHSTVSREYHEFDEQRAVIRRHYPACYVEGEITAACKRIGITRSLWDTWEARIECDRQESLIPAFRDH